MSIPGALLSFPLRPGRAALRLEERPLVAAPFALLAPLAVTGWLLARGCRPGDAFATGLGLLGIEIGLALGGAMASHPASRLVGVRWSARRWVAASTVFAGWSVILLPALALLLRAFGAGSASVLFAGLATLGWGAAAGVRALVAGQEIEGGRALVGSCLGLAGSVAGLWLALWVVIALLVVIAPSPVAEGLISRGDLLLIRRVDHADPGDLVLLQHRDAPDVVVARIDERGNPTPIGVDSMSRDLSTKWDIFGRIFFRFGGSGGGTAALAQHGSS